jgi:hypothetical protein
LVEAAVAETLADLVPGQARGEQLPPSDDPVLPRRQVGNKAIRGLSE